MFAWLACVASGQENSATLTLADALQRAETRNPVLVAQGFGERASEALIDQANLRPNPTLDVIFENFAGTGSVQGIDRLESTVQANQTFERGGKREKRVALAARQHAVALQENAVRRAEIRTQVATAYVALAIAQERLALAGESLQQARETLKLINARISAGASPSVEATRGRAAVAIAQSNYNRASAGVASARATLGATWGGTSFDVPTIGAALRTPGEVPVESSFRPHLSEHPRFNLQTAIIAQRRAALNLEQAHAAQDVTAGGGVRFLREGSDVGLVAAVSVPLPARSANRGNIRAARETLAGAEYSVNAITAELNASFTTAWEGLVAAHTAARTLRQDALPATEAAHVELRRAYESGESPLTDVLESQRALLALRREILTADADYAEAMVRLEALTDSTFPTTAKLLLPP